MNTRSALLPLVLGASIVAPSFAQWPQWGGPKRDFTCDAKGIPDKWPENGPKKLWSRPLGAGYSAIVVDDGKLYTMYREETAGNEVVVAIDAENGKTIWESKYPVEIPSDHVTEFGNGPRSTPLIAGDKLITVGLTGRLACWDRKTGKEIWSQELISRLDGSPLMHGYCTSPMLYKDKVITFVGGGGKAVMAFNLADGKIAWGVGDFVNSYSSPILINVDGQEQIVAYMSDRIAGVAADGSAVLWELPHKNQWATNCFTPVWGPGNLLYTSSEGITGSRCLKLSRTGDKTRVEELWENNTVKIFHTNAIRIGDYYYGSSGGRASMMVCVSVASGEVKWKERGFKLAKLLNADGKLIIFDEDGTLGLAKVTPEKFEVLGKTTVLEGAREWTVPTFATGRLYLRDSKDIAAMTLQ